MRIRDLNWMQVRKYLASDDRAVLPLGSTEQHGYLSLSTDSILSERVAVEAAEPTGVLVFPALAYGITPNYVDFPGSISIKIETYLRFIGDILEGLVRQGFRRILFVNGHGGNCPVEYFLPEWLTGRSDVAIKFHNWYKGPKMWQKVMSLDPVAYHASWVENFPWNRLAAVTLPAEKKEIVDMARLRTQGPGKARDILGDGNYGGRYQASDQEMMEIWQIAVMETRELMEGEWR